MPRWLMEAKPWMSANAMDATMPAKRPIQAESEGIRGCGRREGRDQHLALEPDIDDARSARTTSPARQAASSGIDSRSAESKTVTSKLQIHRLTPSPASGARSRRATEPAEQPVERAGEQDDDAADHHDHVAGDGGLLEGEFRAALIENAEQQRGQHDADRMRAPHERHGDADEAVAGGEFEQEAVLIAHELVDREAARKRAREQHGDDDDARRAKCRHRPRPLGFEPTTRIA